MWGQGQGRDLSVGHVGAEMRLCACDGGGGGGGRGGFEEEANSVDLDLEKIHMRMKYERGIPY